MVEQTIEIFQLFYAITTYINHKSKKRSCDSYTFNAGFENNHTVKQMVYILKVFLYCAYKNLHIPLKNYKTVLFIYFGQHKVGTNPNEVK